MGENQFNIGTVFSIAITLPADLLPDLEHSNQMLDGTKVSSGEDEQKASS